MQMLEVIIMPKKLQVTISDDNANILDNFLVSKNTKSLFVDLAISAYSKTKDGKKFLTNINEDKNKPENINKKNENQFMAVKKVKIEEWS